ncbi:hypothetical protein FB192DRAFT_1370800 [Mucor lusitanicus]|uniref:Uncharacterized protein n=1 Tax=Mucor circinelloides f. lusitanicus TaxID=29924 RepID=A0A8H4F3Y3_MUCCL|nr:hypothetical protein FB192DRAFT_1370800 [Mucor lusitanicus]
MLMSMPSNSTMYYVHDTSPHPVNMWLLNDTTATTNAPPLYRLFVCGNVDQLVDARDKTHATVAIFTNTIISPVESNASTVSINANVTIARPLGPLHTSNIPGYEHWIKISIIKKCQITHMASADVAKTLFERHEGSVQILYDTDKEEPDKEKAEMTRQFAISVMSLLDVVPSDPQQQPATALIHVSNHAKDLYIETISQPVMDETIKHATKRAGASGGKDVDVNSIQPEEAAAPSEPKKPNKYYIPTGRPVGRPRKKVRPKPPGRPKGSKNKVYYYVTEEEEKARLEPEKAEREKAEAVNQATSDANDRAPVQAAPDAVHTLTNTNVNAAAHFGSATAIVPGGVFDMDILPTSITTDTLTEADIQEILIKVVGS